MIRRVVPRLEADEERPRVVPGASKERNVRPPPKMNVQGLSLSCVLRRSWISDGIQGQKPIVVLTPARGLLSYQSPRMPDRRA